MPVMVNRFHPIELTLYDIIFHEKPCISAIDYYGNYLFTCGDDCAVRVWNIKVSNRNKYYEVNCRRTEKNTSLGIELVREFVGFDKMVTAIKIREFGDDLLVAIGTENGTVTLLKIREKDVKGKVERRELNKGMGNACYDLCIGMNKVICGFMSGEIRIIDIDQNKENNKNTEIAEYQVHSGAIQGMSYCETTKMLAIQGSDHCVKVYLINETGIDLIHTVRDGLDKTAAINKRLLIDEEYLYVFKRGFTFTAYDVRDEFKPSWKMGPFNNALKKIVRDGEFTAIFTNASIYILHGEEKVCYVDKAAFCEITDGFMTNGCVFYSSKDGFMRAIRLSLTD
ncbi:hypothetical protein ECANGB1_1855 [Enterospora canceri]|uniref:Uncharacterized protein n=1 Tax=Enterospora canceri TaxID=1081671 RepID=A0A1Y1S5H1_9MICR|nr:hypothetical protein ECANGB1_1855 [Enterospora canceri]